MTLATPGALSLFFCTWASSPSRNNTSRNGREVLPPRKQAFITVLNKSFKFEFVAFDFEDVHDFLKF
jgi:hypothetical protein